jgi:hypothetical protein
MFCGMVSGSSIPKTEIEPRSERGLVVKVRELWKNRRLEGAPSSDAILDRLTGNMGIYQYLKVQRLPARTGNTKNP